MDVHDDLDNLFDKEPDNFEIPMLDESTTDINPFERTLEEELKDLYGSNAPMRAWGDYLTSDQDGPLSSDVKRGGQAQDLHIKAVQSPDKVIDNHNLKSSESQSTDVGSFSSVQKTLSQHQHLPPRFKDLLGRASTPSESELEAADFEIYRIIDYIDTIGLSKELLKVDETLSKQQLFRTCRQALLVSSREPDEPSEVEDDLEQPKQHFDDLLGDAEYLENIGFTSSVSSKQTSLETINKTSANSQKPGKSVGASKSSHATSSGDSSSKVHSPFLQSKPYLYDVDPHTTEGHFLTTSSKSPRRSKSRTSSLASETHFEKESSPLAIEDVSADAFVDAQSPVSNPARVSPQPHLLPAPLFHAADGSRPTSSRSSPTRMTAVSPAASTYAVAGSPTPDPSTISKMDFSAEYHDTSADDELMSDLTPYASDTSQGRSIGRRPSPLCVEHRASDPFVAGADKIDFADVTSSPPLSPLLGLTGQIYQPKRQDRRKAGVRKTKKDAATKTATRAVSARSPSKASVSARANVASARSERAKSVNLGVQGENVKVKKTRATSRKPSTRNVRGRKPQQHDAEDIPRVPSLPQDMDVDLPLPELRVPTSAYEVGPAEPEGGKLRSESKHSPSLKLGDTIPIPMTKDKAKPTARKPSRKTNNNSHEYEGSSSIVEDTTASPVNDATPSPSPRRKGTGTRGIAVRKTRGVVENEHVDDTMQISSPKAIPQPVSSKKTPTKAKNTGKIDSPASSKTDDTVNISPKTPRPRKTKPAAGGKRSRPSEKVDAVDQVKLTPTSAGKKTGGRDVVETSARRSPRIAKMSSQG